MQMSTNGKTNVTAKRIFLPTELQNVLRVLGNYSLSLSQCSPCQGTQKNMIKLKTLNCSCVSQTYLHIKLKFRGKKIFLGTWKVVSILK